MGKRKEDQRTDYDSSSSSSSISFDAKRNRPRDYQNGEKSRTNDGTPWEGFGDFLRDAVIELKDTIQVKLSTEGKFKRKIEKIKEKRKKDKKKHEEDLRILKQELAILKENVRILQEGHQDLKSKIGGMPKEGRAEVQRSQLSQSTNFRLVIENSIITPIYKNETVQTEGGGGHIRVIMYDGGNPIAPDHPLASAKVDLVVIEGRFNEPKRDSWSKEEFEKSIIKPRDGMVRLVKNGTFNLIDGSHDHPGTIIMDNSQKKEVKLGVMIAMHTEERVLEGVSNPFKVQEGKTKRSKEKGKKLCPPAPTRNMAQPTSTQTTQNGQALNSNGQYFYQQTPTQHLGQSTSVYSMHHDGVYHWRQASTQNQLQAVVNPHLSAHGQDQDTSFPYGSSELAHQHPLEEDWLSSIQPSFNPEDVPYSNADTQVVLT
ncbi:uncharacterized protein [Lolium perenne]|uniref:uncharacterized protein isoform X1 n=1 Tax=Lolium perenne TaxID=4522 RepID=UPI0021F669A8|nr:uncharacterized protein LOC127346188 [Lolium perenne]